MPSGTLMVSEVINDEADSNNMDAEVMQLRIDSTSLGNSYIHSYGANNGRDFIYTINTATVIRKVTTICAHAKSRASNHASAPRCVVILVIRQ